MTSLKDTNTRDGIGMGLDEPNAGDWMGLKQYLMKGSNLGSWNYIIGKLGSHIIGTSFGSHDIIERPKYWRWDGSERGCMIGSNLGHEITLFVSLGLALLVRLGLYDFFERPQCLRWDESETGFMKGSNLGSGNYIFVTLWSL